MNKQKLILPISILLGCIILGGFYYASQINKQKMIETADKELRAGLDSCLDSMWSLYGNNDELYKSKSDNCFKEFKK